MTSLDNPAHEQAREEKEALEWLLNRGGMETIVKCSEDFYDCTWRSLEASGDVKFVVIEGIAYWSI